MSLKAFHLLFILISIVGADLFAVWAVWQYYSSGDQVALVLGVVTVAGAIGLVWYAIKLVKSFDAGLR